MGGKEIKIKIKNEKEIEKKEGGKEDGREREKKTYDNNRKSIVYRCDFPLRFSSK